MEYQKLQIFRPIRSKKITQHFHDNEACVYSNGKVVGKGRNGCPHGSEDFYKSIGMKSHGALDIALITGENVLHGATYDGWMKTEVDNKGGIGVDVVSKDPLFFLPHELPSELIPQLEPATFGAQKGYVCHVKERHWHLKSVVGYDGKPVTFGQVIGLGGSTGASTAPHNHYAFKWCDKNGATLLPNNGYYGSFDFSPFYHHETFAGDMIKRELSVEERQQINAQLDSIDALILKIRDYIMSFNKN